jgi:hypothetical protein
VLLLGVRMLCRVLVRRIPTTIDRAEKLARCLDVVWFVDLEEPALPEVRFGGLIDRWTLPVARNGYSAWAVGLLRLVDGPPRRACYNFSDRPGSAAMSTKRPKDPERAPEPISEEQARRDFLKTAGRFAVVTPPAITLLLGTSLNSRAIARSAGSGGSGGSRPGYGFGHSHHAHHSHHDHRGPPGRK